MGKLIYREDDGTEYEVPMGWLPHPGYQPNDIVLTAAIAGGAATVTIRVRADGTWVTEACHYGSSTGPEWRHAGDIMSRIPKTPMTEAQLQAIQDWTELPERAPYGISKLGLGLRIETGVEPPLTRRS